MMRTFATSAILAAGCAALAACGPSEASEPAGEASATAAPASADLSDSLVTCAMPGYGDADGLTVTQSFVLVDGQVKRYSEFQNHAFDLCEAGQPNCRLELDDGLITMDWTSEGGARSRYEVDLASLLITARETKPGDEERVVSFEEGAKCRRDPLPEGITIN
tara:strand:- start:297 stop:785 length:489 start_codon:yes stop_codon:yes gene_type:complete